MEKTTESKKRGSAKLTSATAIDKVRYKPEFGEQKMFSCGDGLYLLVKPTSKTWVYRYRFQGKQKTMGFGNYKVVDYERAMEKRDEAKRKLDHKLSPLDKHEKSITLSKFFDDHYIKENKALTEGVRFKQKQAFDKHVRPYLGESKLEDVTPFQVVTWLKEANLDILLLCRTIRSSYLMLWRAKYLFLNGIRACFFIRCRL